MPQTTPSSAARASYASTAGKWRVICLYKTGRLLRERNVSPAVAEQYEAFISEFLREFPYPPFSINPSAIRKYLSGEKADRDMRGQALSFFYSHVWGASARFAHWRPNGPAALPLARWQTLFRTRQKIE